jgi:hypothetical protein
MKFPLKLMMEMKTKNKTLAIAFIFIVVLPRILTVDHKTHEAGPFPMSHHPIANGKQSKAECLEIRGY